MKLIIDIPERIFDTIQADEMISREQLAILQMHILNGTPLDDVKAEIDKLPIILLGGYYFIDKDDVMQILDNTGKGESNQHYACCTCKFASIHCTRYDGDVAATDYCGNWEGDE